MDYNIQYMLTVIDQLTPALRRAQAQLKNIDKQLKQLGKTVPLKIDATQALATLRRAQAQAKGMGKTLQGLNKPVHVKVDISQAQAALKKLRSPELKASIKAAASSARANSVHGGGGRLHGGISVANIAQGATAYTGVKSALDLAQASTELSKATNASGQDLENLKKIAIDLESATGQSAAELMGMMTNASKAGVETKNLAADLLFTSKAAVAFGMSNDEAATGISELRSSFFSGQDYATQQIGLKNMAEMISYIADNSASSEPYLVNFMQRASGIEKTMGASREAMAAMGATFEAIGIPAEVAARAVNSASTSMAGLTKDNKSLAALGLDPAAFRASVEKDVVGAMFDVVKATQGMDKVSQTLMLKDIFGEGFADELVRMGGAVSIYKDNLALAGDKAKQAAAFEAAYKIQMDGLNASVDRATSGFKTMLGVAIAPYLKSAADAAAPLIEWMKEHPQVVAFAAGLVALAVGVAVVGFTLSGLTSGIGIVSGGLVALATRAVAMLLVVKKLAASFMIAGTISGYGSALLSALNPVGLFRNAMIGLNAAIMANPIGFIVGGLVAFVALCALAWDHSATLRETVAKLAQPFTLLGDALGITTDFGTAFDYTMVAIGASLSAALIPITGLIENFKLLGTAWDNIQAGNYGEAAGDILGAMTGGGWRKEIERVGTGAVQDWNAVGVKHEDARNRSIVDAGAARYASYGNSPIVTSQPKIDAVRNAAGIGGGADKVALAAQTYQQSATTGAQTAQQNTQVAETMMTAASKQSDANSQLVGIINQFGAAVNTFAANASNLKVTVVGGLGDQGRG